MRRKIYKFGQIISAITASAIVLITVVDVVLRYFMNSSIFGSSELTNMLLAVVVGAGLIVVAHDRLHINVDLFRPQLEKYFGNRYSIWTRAWEFAGTIALTVLLIRNAFHVLKSNETTPVLEVQIGWVYILTAVLVLMAAISMVLSEFADDNKHERDEE